jgi:phosphoribosylanthranilate isomerase
MDECFTWQENEILWTLSRKICEAINVPVFLAGCLKPDNVAEAIRSESVQWCADK